MHTQSSPSSRTNRRTKRNCLPFEEARTYARSLGLKNQIEWNAWMKAGARPANIPTAADSVYKDKGWLGWGDWLGTAIGRALQRRQRRTTRFLPYEEARTYVRLLGLKNQIEWKAWARSTARPADIPSQAARAYKDRG